MSLSLGRPGAHPVDTQWSAMAHLVPRRIGQWRRMEREVRGEPWVFLGNASDGTKLRLDLSAIEILDLVDGQRDLASICNYIGSENDIEDRRHVHDTLAILSEHGLIQFGTIADTLLLIRRGERQNAFRRRSYLNPLSLRFDLFNPDQFLDHLSGIGRVLFTRTFAMLLLALYISALVLAFEHWKALGSAMQRLLQSPTNFWTVALIYPLLKICHELAHALAVKRWGGSVHALGVSFLVLVPVPHVDASDAWLFSSRRQRMLVGAAGVLAELALASLALWVFVSVEPGLLRDLAFSLALTGSVVTVLFNGNPLLRFDGYHVLQDALEIPNLATRATLYFRYVLQRHLLGIRNRHSPVTVASERHWLFGYAIASGAYRILLVFLIVFMLAGRLPLIGPLLALFATATMLLLPIYRGVSYLASSPDLAADRQQAVLRAGAVCALILLTLTLVPWPSSTRIEGVVAVPRQAQLHAPDDAILETMHAVAGEDVRAGDALFTLKSETLETDVLAARARVQTLDLDIAEARVAGSPRLGGLIKQRALAADDATLLQQRLDALDVRAPNAGRLALASDDIVTGVRLEAGSPFAFVVQRDELQVHAVAPESKLAMVNRGVRSARVRLAEQFGTVLAAELLREVPEGDRQLPSEALAWNGRGGISVARGADGQIEALNPVFHMDLALPPESRATGIGARAYVTLVHSPETMLSRGWRVFRQQVLERLGF